MSNFFMVHLIMDNEIDMRFIDKTFNLDLSQCDDIVALNDSVIIPRIDYVGMLSFNGENSKMMCYSIENGNSMFMRNKYSYYNIRHNEYITRDGNVMKNRGTSGQLATQEEIDELSSLDNPPISELGKIFDYILSKNANFYLFFSELHVDEIIKDGKVYFESMLKNRIIYENKSQFTQNLLINMFNSTNENPHYGLIYDIEIFNKIIGNKNTQSLNEIVFKII